MITTDNTQTLANALAEIKRLEGEVQRQRERHRTTWTQLEQVNNAMRRIIERCEVFIDDEAEMSTASVEALMGIAEDALSHQAEPECSRCDGFGKELTVYQGGIPCRVCQAEPAPAQDEREAFDLAYQCAVDNGWESTKELARYIWDHANARPAQTEQQSIVDSGLLDRIDAAISAFTSGKASMHVPPEPTDVDIVLGDCWELVKRLGATPQPALYTCIGKGGEYELIGRAKTAGSLKMTGRFADEVIVYRDVSSDAIYCRTPGDFRLRMERATPSPAMDAKEE